jgi:hypothetical protein
MLELCCFRFDVWASLVVDARLSYVAFALTSGLSCGRCALELRCFRFDVWASLVVDARLSYVAFALTSGPLLWSMRA